MIESSKVRICVGVVAVALLSGIVVAPAGSVVAHRSAPAPAALCRFVSSAKDGSDKEAVNFKTGQAKVSLDALRKAAKLKLAGELAGAIKQLIPLYELLAHGGNSAAYTKLDDYATKHCRFKNAADIDACGLVSPEEAAVLTGVPMTLFSSTSAHCDYSGHPDGTSPIVEVYVGDGAKQLLDTDRRLAELNPNPDGTPRDVPSVPGIGDEAYQGADRVLVFQKSGVWVAINVIASGDHQQALLDLARTVVTKL
jgi:hypothetical protein